MPPIRWTKNDKKRVKGILTQIAATCGGWAGMADKLGIRDKDGHPIRATPQAWSARGRVPTAQVHAVIALAPKSLTLTPSDLNPDARTLEQTQ